MEGYSFCIPVFGTHDYVEDLIISISNQKFCKYNDNYEILLGVDGDKTSFETIKSFKSKYKNIRLFYDSVNRGKFITENTLFSHSKFDNIVFIDSDDVFITDDLIEILNKYKKYDIVSFSFENTAVSQSMKGKEKIVKECGGNFFVKKHVFADMNGFPDWKCRADGPFHTRASQLGYKIIVTEEVLVKRHLRKDSLLHCKQYGEHSQIRKHYKEIHLKNLRSGRYRCESLVVNDSMKEII